MKNSLLLLTGLLVCLFVLSCEYDNEEELYPGGCDLTTVTYSQTIAPIVANNCLDAACHGGTAALSGLPFETYDGLKVVVNNLRLVGSLRHETGYSFMPKNTSSLPECDIQKFEKWVNEGALNN